jgi:gluconokinase
MLTSALPVSVNGQAPPSPTNISTVRQVLSSKPAQSMLSSAVAASSASNGSAVLNKNHAPPKYHHIWLVTGPAGCGKSTVAEYLANALGIPYIEGDKFHPKSNVDKMTNGIPLTDADRWDWLTALREESTRQLQSGYDGVVLTCSALKRKYRDVIRVAGYFDHSLLLHFIYLDAPESVLLKRVAARQNHFMSADMVQSQFDILQPPMADETDVIKIDVTRPVDVVKAEALSKVIAAMEKV